MTFLDDVYVAGSSTPNLAGLLEVGSIRISGAGDGTFELHRLGGILDGSASVRDFVSDLPNDHGGFAGLALNGPRLIVVEGLLTVPTLDDVWGARDLLEQTFDVELGLQTWTVNTTAWSEVRQVTAQVVGDGVRIVEPDGMAKLLPDRLFTVTAVAPDPRIYSVTEHTQTIGTNTSVTNAGNKACPVKVRFNGPQENPKIDLHGTSGSARIRFNGTITSGGYVEVSANAASAEGVYAVDDTGVNAMGTDSAYGGPVSAFTLRKIAAGTTAYDASNDDSGAGTTVLYWRDAW